MLGNSILVLFDWPNNTGAVNVKTDGYILEEKSSFEKLGLTFSSQLDWGSYIISIDKTNSKKIGAFIRSMKCLSPEVALYLYKSTIRPCMEYCFHVWAGYPSCYLDLLNKLQKQICRTVDPSPSAPPSGLLGPSPTFFHCSSFLNRFPVFLNIHVFLFYVTPCLVVAVIYMQLLNNQFLRIENIHYSKKYWKMTKDVAFYWQIC